jgi:hypothetical protein
MVDGRVALVLVALVAGEGPDTDGDGTPDSEDGCPRNELKIVPDCEFRIYAGALSSELIRISHLAGPDPGFLPNPLQAGK